MKSWTTLLKAALCMVLIFGAGVWVGRTTAPREKATLVTSAGTPVPENSRTPANRAREILTRYAEALDLTTEQQEAIWPDIEKAARRMRSLPRRSEARMGTIERFHQEMEKHLTDSQKIIAREILEESRATKQ